MVELKKFEVYFNDLLKRRSLPHGFLIISKSSLVINDCKKILKEKVFNFKERELGDLFEIKGLSSISIDKIRELKEFLGTRPIFSNKKVVFIERAEDLTEEASQAFLKILEEPPKFAFLFLFTKNPKVLKKTIVSRLIPYEFFLKEGNFNIEGMEKILKMDLLSQFRFSEDISLEPEEVENFFNSCIIYFHKKALDGEELAKEALKNIINFKKKLSLKKISPELVLKSFFCSILWRSFQK